MSKMIREKYEAGSLVSREIEGSSVSFLEIAKLCIHLVIAVSVAQREIASREPRSEGHQRQEEDVCQRSSFE